MLDFYFQNLDSPGVWDLGATDKVLTRDKLSTLLKTRSFSTHRTCTSSVDALLLTQSY